MKVVLDDFIPCTFDGFPAFTQNKGPELWVIFLEKAWAKVHGSYERIVAGIVHQTMRDLTGAPSYEYLINDNISTDSSKFNSADLFDKISEAESKNWIVGASTHVENEEQRKLIEQLGLLGNHAYSILRTSIVEDKKGRIRQLLLLRNPWGKFEWKGDWSFNSDSWTPELRK